MLPISESTRNLGDSRNALALMTIILLVAFGLGMPGLNLEPVWFDEFASITFMGGMAPPYSPQQIVATVSQRAWDHVPFYYLFGAGWASFVGWSQFALRLLSLLSGVVMISWLFRFASDTIDKRTAILAALLMSTSAFVIVYFHELRAYSLLMLLAIVHIWLYWRLLTCKRITKLTWICFTSLNHSSAIYSQLQPFSACWLRCVTSAPGTAFSQVAKHHIGMGNRRADVFALLAWADFW